MTKECECAAHSAVECCCGAWDEPQRTWVGLTDDERNSIFELHHTRLGGWDYSGDEVMYDEHFKDAVATIEAKLKEKNT